MNKRTQRPQAIGTATAPLLYWLALVSGLVGLTMLRLDDVDHVVPIWFGGIVGVAFGELLGVLRIRVWTIAAVTFAASWFIGPAFYFTLVGLFGADNAAETAFMVLIPAFICGYASLTERGGLLAFWFPAMLWMLVILEGEAPGSFAPRGSVPLILGLAALFMAFLRARETRRVALWKAYATVGLATPAPRMVLRGSPVRGLAQMLWTVGVGGGALLLAAWIAPKLWEKDRELHHRAVMAAAAPPPAAVQISNDGLPCCPDDRYFEREKIREYMPLRSSREEQRARERERDLALTCSYCAPPPKPEQLWYSEGPGCGLRTMDPRTLYANDPWAMPRGDVGYYGGGFGNMGGETTTYYNPSSSTTSYGSSYVPPAYVPPARPQGMPAGYPMTSYTPPVVVETPPPPPLPPPPPPPPPPVVKKATTKKPTVKSPPVVEAPVAKPTPKPSLKTPTITVAPPKPQAAPPPPAVVAAQPTAPPTPDTGMPWRFIFPLFAAGLAFPLVSRITRRKITLRHLARPFWRESVEQRISNHWQRMLVGLRDAGIQPRKNEQPQAFAKRIGIAGMQECATILERVRHGVRVEDDDLGTMHASTDAVVCTSCTRAGVSGRVAAVFRWPLV